ncbi:MAG: hypothetical protein ACREEM_55575, partial [Blastocatellia bacterium]
MNAEESQGDHQYRCASALPDLMLGTSILSAHWPGFLRVFAPLRQWLLNLIKGAASGDGPDGLDLVAAHAHDPV